MKDVLKVLLKVFVMVTTGSLIAATIIVCLINGYSNTPSDILWQILVESAACAISSLVYFNAQKFIVRIIIHYFIINAIVLGFGYWFGWFEFKNFLVILIMILIIAAIFFIVTFTMIISSKKETEKINERLKKRQEKQDEDLK